MVRRQTEWSQGAVAAVLQKESAKGSWYMADFIETSDLWRRRSKGETSSRAEPWQRKRNCISACFYSRSCCQYNLACHTLCLFLDWVKHIHSRTKCIQERDEEKQRPSLSNSLLLRFYSLCYAYTGFRDAIRVLIATIPRGITAGVLNWIYFCALYIYI